MEPEQSGVAIAAKLVVSFSLRLQLGRRLDVSLG